MYFNNRNDNKFVKQTINNKNFMKNNIWVFLLLFVFSISMSSCVSKKKFKDVNAQLQMKENELFQANKELDDCLSKNGINKQTISTLNNDYGRIQGELNLREEQIGDLREQIEDLKKLRDMQLDAVGNLTVLSKEANENINNTLKQIEKKDRYINLLQKAKSKADSVNLALAVNLKKNLAQGINDQDIEVKVDKTVVFINLSDKMLFSSGSSRISSQANDVLSKIATIIKENPDLEIMVEGYTDSKSISSDCIKDNWDLSAMRATSVVRALSTNYGVNPSRLVAAGRGEYNPVASNDTSEGRSMNRRTRIVLLPKLEQFYDLLSPSNIPN